MTSLSLEKVDALPLRAFLGRTLALYSQSMIGNDRQDADALARGDVAKALEGDGDAFERLVRRYQDAVSRQMWRFTRDRAEHAELVHDVFVRAFLSLKGYRGAGPFAHWLRKIAVRVGYAYWRRRERERQVAPGEALAGLPDKLASDPSEMSAREAAEVVHEVLDQLPPRDRLVLTLQYIEEKSVNEVAEMTGWSAAMVKVQAWRARAKFKKLMERLEDSGRP